jgi:Zn-dependent protease with chaperone function
MLPAAPTFNCGRDTLYPGEGSALFASIVMLIVALLFFLTISVGWALVFLVVGLLYIKIRQNTLIGNAALVTDSSFSCVHHTLKTVSEALRLPQTRAHVIQDPTLNAFAIGASAPFSIVLHSALMEAMAPDELLYVVGHEAGHIKARHTILLSLVAPFGKSVPGFDFLFGFWQRRAEYTADRAGLICCRNVGAAVRALLKISSGPNALAHTNVHQFLAQISRIDSPNLYEIGETLGTHPYMTNRIRELILFDRTQGISIAQECSKANQQCVNSGLPTTSDAETRSGCGSELVPEHHSTRHGSNTQPEPITNETVMKLLAVGIPEDLIVNKIQHNPVQFDLCPSALIRLKEAGVPDALLRAMFAAESQTTRAMD